MAMAYVQRVIPKLKTHCVDSVLYAFFSLVSMAMYATFVASCARWDFAIDDEFDLHLILIGGVVGVILLHLTLKGILLLIPLVCLWIGAVSYSITDGLTRPGVLHGGPDIEHLIHTVDMLEDTLFIVATVPATIALVIVMRPSSLKWFWRNRVLI